MDYEIHCPNCGELRRNMVKGCKRCPDCGNEQAIFMNDRIDIRDRVNLDKGRDVRGYKPRKLCDPERE